MEPGRAQEIREAFAVLGIAPTGDRDAVLRAWRQATRAANPETGGGAQTAEARERFVASGAACGLLLTALENPRLLDDLRAAVAPAPAATTPVSATPGPASPPTLTVREARRLLIELREFVIQPAHPEVPWEHGILRKTLLEWTLARLPKTRDGWEAAVPADLRAGVAPEHLPYVERIVAITTRVVTAENEERTE